MARHALTPAHIASRIAVGVAALVGLGVDYEDAEMGVLMLAFLVFLGLFLWSFAAAGRVIDALPSGSRPA